MDKMFLSRFVISKKSIILEINPNTGDILKRFKQPKNWKWDGNRAQANWEKYKGKTFLVYIYKGNLIFQEGNNRFEIDSNYSSNMVRKGFKWIEFQLLKNNKKVYTFKYQDPQTRPGSLLRAFFFDDDWWDWDTPFENVHNYINKKGIYK